MPANEIERAWAALQRGDVQASFNLFAGIAGRFPDRAEAHAGLGHVLLRLGRDSDAVASLMRARDLAANLPQVWRDLGLVAMRRSDFAAAAADVERSLRLNPDDANAWFLLAQAQFARSRFDDAESAFARAAQLHPSFLEARFKLGNIAYDKKAYAAASRHYHAFVSARPADLNGWINYGMSLAHAGEWPAARAAFETAVALAPDQIKPVALLASVLKETQAPAAEIAPVARRVLELSPESVDMRVQLARCQFDELRYADAHASLRRALELDPGDLVARWLQFQMPENVVAQSLAEHEGYLERWRAGLEYFERLDGGDPRVAAQAQELLAAATNFYLAYQGKALLEEQMRYGALLRKFARIAWPLRHDVPMRRIGAKRRRIAIFSASLHEHSVSRVWSPALLSLASEDFELGAFHPGRIEDASTRRWREKTPVFEFGMRPVSEWIAALREFAPDIVIFPDIGMDRVTQAVASLRHAPVQIATWGHPVTSGMPAIDYFLSADACEPDDASRHYSETLVRLPRLGTSLEPPDATTLPEARRRDDRAVHLVCAQSADKLHPGHDAVFARILQAAPAARLDILCSMPAQHVVDALAARMRAVFASHGLDFDARCRVHPRLPVEEYYRFLAQADACLDSLDFSGCITSFDALWRDVPIVTLPGRLMRGRQTCGMLRLLGLEELVAADVDDYVRIASRLALDAAWRDSLGRRIRDGKAGLYRDASVTTALADFLRTVEAPAPERAENAKS